jgi:hypothetical protein
MNLQQELNQREYQFTNLSSRNELVQRLLNGPEARANFVNSHLDKKLAFQIRSFRGEDSQEEAEDHTGIKQQVWSRLENPSYGKATLTTLKKIAAAYDVGLLVEFVPFSQLVNRVSGTPYVERGYSPDTMNVPSFEKERELGTLNECVSDSSWSIKIVTAYQDSAPLGETRQPIPPTPERASLSEPLAVAARTGASGAIEVDESALPKREKAELRVMEVPRLHLVASSTKRRFKFRKENLWRNKIQAEKATKKPASSVPFTDEERISNPYTPTASTSNHQSGT